MRVAVVGVTGMIGNVMLEVLAGSLEKAGFEREDFVTFRTRTFRKNSHGIAVFEGFGYGSDFGGIAFGAFIA